LEKKVLEKIKFQWKTLRKAFQDMNLEKTGTIKPHEFRYYMKHWGIEVKDEWFMKLFNKFDADKDGQISYKDFQTTVGAEIHPAEGQFFRWDKAANLRITSCKHERCWAATPMYTNFCALHEKMHRDQVIELFGQMFKKISKNWKTFINDLKAQAMPEDKCQVFFDEFLITCANYGFHLNDAQK
jgi:hypothetical protein